MVDDDVLLPDRGEAVAAEIADALGEARVVGREDEVRPVVDDELARIGETEKPVELEHVVARHVEPLGQEFLQIDRHALVDREADDVAAPAPLQRRLVEPDQVLGLFLDLDVAVAQDAEHAAPDHLEAGEQLVEIKPDHLLHRDEAVRLAGQPDEARDRAGDEEERLGALAVALAVELQREAEAEIDDERERMRRVDRERRQDREYLAPEALGEPGMLLVRQIGRAHDRDAGLVELALERAPRHLLVAHQAARALVDGVELLRRRQPVLRRRGDAGLDLALEAGDPHHVELVEVVGRDRQEAQPFEQRMARIVGLGEDALVEGEPRQLAIDEALGRVFADRGRVSRARGFGHSGPPFPARDGTVYNGAMKISFQDRGRR